MTGNMLSYYYFIPRQALYHQGYYLARPGDVDEERPPMTKRTSPTSISA